MTTIVTRAGKGSALTHNEMDANLTNLNTDKIETSAIGVTVQAYSANLDEYAAVNPTAAGLALLDDATAADQRTTLGLGNSSTLNVGTTAGTVAAGDHNHSGVYEPVDATILRDADIGVSVQAYDAQLADIAGLTPTDNGVVIGNGANFVVETGSTLRTSLGLAIGTDVQAYDAVLQGIADDTTALGGFRNKIIGGDFTTNPWQRGTSFTAPAANSYTADRFLVAGTSDAVVNILKTADAPTAAQAGVYTADCLHADVTTTDASIAAGQSYQIQHKIEGLNSAAFGFGQAGTRYVTLSFWHKHTKTGTYCVSFLNSAVNRSYVAEYTQDVTDTWEKATITIPVDTSGTWLYDTGIGISIDFVMASGSTYHTTANAWQAGNFRATANQVNALDSTANNFKIALVQLEAGSVATPFETRSVGQELALCQRYYYRTTAASAGDVLTEGSYATSTTNLQGFNKFPVSMRTSPAALEQSGTATDYRVIGAGASSTVCSAAPTFSSANTERARTNFTVASGLVVYNGGSGGAASGVSTSYLGWSAEL